MLLKSITTHMSSSSGLYMEWWPKCPVNMNILKFSIEIYIITFCMLSRIILVSNLSLYRNGRGSLDVHSLPYFLEKIGRSLWCYCGRNIFLFISWIITIFFFQSSLMALLNSWLITWQLSYLIHISMKTLMRYRTGPGCINFSKLWFVIPLNRYPWIYLPS